MSGARITMICMFATTLAVSVGGCAQASKAIAQKLCDQVDQANANNDLNQVLRFYDSSYVETDERGKSVAYAEWRRQLEQNSSLVRRWNPGTTVQDVQLAGDRMVIYYKWETHFEFYLRRNCWVPEISKGSGKSTWERKGGEWKLVRGKTLSADTQVDPKWVEKVKTDIAIDWARVPGEICHETPNHPCPAIDTRLHTDHICVGN